MNEDDLLPPTGEAMLSYLRFDPAALATPMDRVLDNLVSELGHAGLIDEAIVRATGLPVPLPASLIGAIGDLGEEQRLSLFGRMARTAGSPLSKLHLIRLLLAFRRDRPSYARLARRIVTNLVDNPKELQAFRAVLEWAYCALMQWPEATGGLPEVLLAVSWSHAHQLCRMLSALGAPPEWIRDQFSEMAHARLVELFKREPHLCFDVSHPRFATPEVLLLTGLSYAIHGEADLFAEEFRQAILSNLFAISGQHPLVTLLTDTSYLRNGLLSFLGTDRSTAVAAVGLNGTEVFPPDVKQALANEIVERLARAPQDMENWYAIHLLLADFPVDQDLSDRLDPAIGQIDFVTLTAEQPVFGVYALSIVSYRAEHIPEKLRQYLVEQLKGATLLSLTQEQKSLLIEVALNLSRGGPQPPEALAQLLGHLFDTWQDDPDICESGRSLVQALTERLPMNEAQHFWPLLVRLRAK